MNNYWFNQFDHTYIISLESSFEERLLPLTNHLCDIEFKSEYSVIDAIDYMNLHGKGIYEHFKKINNTNDFPWRIRNLDGFQRAEIACGLSHAKTLRKVIDLYWERLRRGETSTKVLICEDDIRFKNIKINHFDHLPNDWEIAYPFYLHFEDDPGTFLHSIGYNINLEKINPYVAIAHDGILSTACYAVHIQNIDTVKKIQGVIKHLEMGSIADLCLSKSLLRKYIFNKKLVEHIESDSTVYPNENAKSIQQAAKKDAWESGFVRGCNSYMLHPFLPKSKPHRILICKDDQDKVHYRDVKFSENISNLINKYVNDPYINKVWELQYNDPKNFNIAKKIKHT